MKHLHSLFLLVLLLANSAYSNTLAPQFSLTKGENFPSTLFEDSTYTLPIVFTNTSSIPLVVTNMFLATSPAGLSLPTSNNCLNTPLQPLQTCTFNVTYSPAQIGTYPLQIQVAANGYVWKRTNTPLLLTVNSADTRANLDSSQTLLTLTLGQTTTWTLHNDSTTSSAEHVSVNVPANLMQYIGSISTCDTIAPQSNCDVSIVVLSTLPAGLTGTFTAQGDNTNQVSVDYAAANTTLITASSLMFDQPEQPQNLTITNSGNVAVDIVSVDLDSSIHEVSPTSGIPSACHNLLPNTNCVIPYQATISAYGSGNATISYHPVNDTSVSTITTPVTVANADITINNGSYIIPSTLPGGSTFTIENTSNFNWLNPSISFSSNTISILSQTCSGVIPPHVTCTYTFNVANPAPPVVTLTATGTNSVTRVATILTNILSITPGGSTEQHLEYAPIDITNSSTEDETLQTITAPSSVDIGNGNQALLCSATDTNCLTSYRSTCTNDVVLATGTSCKLWYRIVSEDNLTAAATKQETVTVVVSGGDTKPQRTFEQNINFSSDTALYVGGTFSTVGSTHLTNSHLIAKWDGTAWTALNTSTGNSVNALTLFNGDLYAGGKFGVLGSITASNVAKWNGTAWSAVGAGTNDDVNALASSQGNLYVGGNFSQAGGVTTNNIAEWNGTSWSALSSSLNGDVYSLLVNQNILYVGGAFAQGIKSWDGTSWNELSGGVQDTINSIAADSSNNIYACGATGTIKKWNGNSWIALGEEATGIIHGCAVDSTNNLYIGGSFPSVNRTPVQNIAKWNGTSWSNVGAGTNGIIYAILPFSDYIYIGGFFTSANGSTVSNLAELVSGNFATISPDFKVNSDVKALLVAPSLILTVSG